MRKVYVVGGDTSYANWMQGEITNDIKKADLVVFTGGEDVNPELYDSVAHPRSYWNRHRDTRELAAYGEARELNKPLVGVCRGSQLLCALAGGSMVQHQSHPFHHTIETSLGEEIRVTSTHHQRQYPWGNKKPKFELLGWSNNLSPYSQGSDVNDDLSGKPEVEMAYYPDIKALAIQSHPEMVYPFTSGWEQKYIQFCRQILNEVM